jgi:hypothetical protein
MGKKRVLLACPAFAEVEAWLALVQRLLGGVTVVGRTLNPIDTLLEAKATEANVVVVDLPVDGSDPGVHSHLLAELPDAKVLAVSSDGLDAVLYRRGVVRTDFPCREMFEPGRLAVLLAE